MTIFKNSIFYPASNNIKVKDNSFSVISGANTLSSIPMCGLSIEYAQYQRLSVQIPKGQTDYILSFPMLGIKPTFLTIIPKYISVDPSVNYLKWKFQSSSDAKWSMTNILTLTGTTSNPIPPIVIDNPNQDYPIQIEILVSALDNDYLNDIAAFVYLDQLTFDKVQTYNQTNSGVLALYNSSNQLVSTINISDIINVTRVYGQNRIIIDEASENNVVLDFVSEYDTTQAESAIFWLMIDPANRLLPQSADTTAPVINFSSSVVSNSITIDLSNYTNSTLTKQDIITESIQSVIDNRDGAIVTLPNHLTLYHSSQEINTILSAGNYTAVFKISDIAGNLTTETLSIVATDVIIDTTAPVITTTASVIGSVVNSFNLSSFGGTYTHNDARIMCLLSIIDDIDGTLPLSSASVQFLDSLLAPVTDITSAGSYSIIFTATDSSSNSTVLPLTVNIY